MKGVVLSLPARGRRRHVKGDFSFYVFLKRNLTTILFTLVFAAGFVWGAMVSLKADEGFLGKMDFLFTTNLDSRLSMGALSSFAAHFASNFIFFAACALCGLSPWGVGVLPFVLAFKGFGTGLSAVYLISTYGLKGIGFYIVVVLPGAFICSMALIFMCSECSRTSVKLARYVFSDSEGAKPFLLVAKKYLSGCVRFLFVLALGALCDMFLWSFVSKLFF